MKLYLSQKALASALESLRLTVDLGNFSLFYSNQIFISARQGHCILALSCITASANIEIPAEVEEEGAIFLSFQLLSGLVESLGNNDIIFLHQPSFEFCRFESIRAGITKNIAKIPCIKSAYPPIFARDYKLENRMFHTSEYNVKHAIYDAYKFSVSSDKQFTSSLCMQRSIENKLLFSSTNIESACLVNLGCNTAIQHQILLPIKSCGNFARVLFSEPGHSVYCYFYRGEEEMIVFSLPRLHLDFFVKIVHDNFPDIEKLQSRDYDVEVHISPTEFLAAIKKCALYGHTAILRLQGKTLEVSSNNHEYGGNTSFLEALTVIQITSAITPQFTVKVNCEKIVNMLERITDNTATLFVRMRMPFLVAMSSGETKFYLNPG